MSAIRTLGSVAVVSGTPTPIYTGPVVSAVSFSIKNNIATIVLGSANLPKSGYNGPNGYPAQNAATGSKFDNVGGVYGQSASSSYNGGNGASGQQVTLWGFTTATYFNGKTVTVLDNNPADGSFRFYFTHADVGSTNDAGKTAAAPAQTYRAVRLEVGQGNGTDWVYVGDGNVSSSQYMAALSLTGQPSIVIAGDNIPANRIFIDGTTSATDTVQVTLLK